MKLTLKNFSFEGTVDEFSTLIKLCPHILPVENNDIPTVPIHNTNKKCVDTGVNTQPNPATGLPEKRRGNKANHNARRYEIKKEKIKASKSEAEATKLQQEQLNFNPFIHRTPGILRFRPDIGEMTLEEWYEERVKRRRQFALENNFIPKILTFKQCVIQFLIIDLDRYLNQMKDPYEKIEPYMTLNKIAEEKTNRRVALSSTSAIPASILNVKYYVPEICKKVHEYFENPEEIKEEDFVYTVTWWDRDTLKTSVPGEPVTFKSIIKEYSKTFITLREWCYKYAEKKFPETIQLGRGYLNTQFIEKLDKMCEGGLKYDFKKELQRIHFEAEKRAQLEYERETHHYPLENPITIPIWPIMQVHEFRDKPNKNKKSS